jgi:hypothetical protein
MDILKTLKILVAPYIAFLVLLLFLITDDQVYLFLASGILLIFALAATVILMFILLRFGIESTLEFEIEPLPWVVFFLSLIIYIFLNLNS